MPGEQRPTNVVGPNAWLVDEMYEHYLADPRSVSDSWQEFFADYRPGGDHPPATAAGSISPMAASGVPVDQASARPLTAAPARKTPEPAPAPKPAAKAAGTKQDGSKQDGSKQGGGKKDGDGGVPGGEPLRGVAARIVANMEASLSVPTATSYREIPAKLLEVNRSVINGYLGRTGRGKVSFTHLIGFAVVRAVAQSVPVMNNHYIQGPDTKPYVVKPEHVGLGIAVDIAKPDGSRSLLVPVVKKADTLDFRGFWTAYEDLIRKVRSNKLTPDDFSGGTLSLTNPGTIGTVKSVPRLMPGQGVIVGTGSLDFPTAFAGADPAALADLGVSKVMTVSSTYDHRIIQGAESGLFLKRVHELLMGADDFYDDIFRALGVPYEAVDWRRDVNPTDHDQSMVEKQMSVTRIIDMHRVRGHLIADLDPLSAEEPHMHPELDPATYGLTIWDLDRTFLTGGVGGRHRMRLGDLLHVLRDAYCRTIGIEYMHIEDPEEKDWLQDLVEDQPDELSAEEKRHILGRLNAAEALEQFLGKKYVGQKRFGIDGAESAIPILDAILAESADTHLDSAVMGMAHRGRLNVLVNIVGKSYDQLFKEFEGNIDPESIQGSGDVKYHLGQTGKYVSPKGNTITVDLAANPSHLECVDPVVVGMARAKMDKIEPPGDYPVLPLLIHGDAAFAGQGVVAETLNLSNIHGYKVGGTIHLIINNQLGFTTPPEAARSSEYPTDVAKMVSAPIFHVNGDDPEACVRVARMAFAYRKRWHKDVVIDMVCYRRFGHNEGDDPSYTQPEMYRRIDAKRSVRKIYTERLVKRGDISLEEAEAALDDFQQRLQTALDETKQAAPPGGRIPTPLPPVGVLPQVDTGVPSERLHKVFDAIDTNPPDFTVHHKLVRQLANRAKMFREEGEVDWALGEALAFGSLLDEGTSVRLAGEDSRRGTFSQRHLVLVDYETGFEHTPLAALTDDGGTGGAHFWLYDSLLSEFAALGFEYGYSVESKDTLVIWEAQFGDFVNGAQVILDQFVTAGEDKWEQTSGLVMLLPHGYEGQGPEHSSARIERFLTAAAEDNIQVCNATNAAQYFHLLRRQIKREVRKPLVIFTPKSLLRAKAARSPVSALESGSFQEVLDDPALTVEPSEVKRIVLASGKVAVEALAARAKGGGDVPVAIVRVEQLYPWPFAAVAAIVERYGNAEQIVWLQEEPENMGPWNFIKGNVYMHYGDTHTIRRMSRTESGSPATGVKAIHDQEQELLLAAALDVDAPT